MAAPKGELRFEAWTLPTAATFKRTHSSVPALPGAQGRKELSGWSDCVLPVPDSWSGLSSLMTAGTMFAVYDGDTWIEDFIAERAPRSLTRGDTVDISGPTVAALTSKIGIYPPDYPENPSQRPNWQWGADSILPPLALGDLGSIREQWELYNDQTGGGTFTVTVDGQTTESLAYNVSANTLEGSATGGTGLQGLSTVSDVTVTGTGTSDDPWIITFFDPPDPTTITKTDANGLTSTLTKTVEGDPDPSPVTQSRPVDSGTQDTEVHGTYDDPAVQVVTTPLDTGADWSLLVNATGRFAGSQIVLNVNPGETYQASIRVRPTITSDFVLVIHDEFQNQIARTADTNLTAGSFQTLSLSDVVIPPGVTRVIFRVAVVDTTPANIGDHYVNWQGATFYPGLVATNAGDIVKTLLEAAQDRDVGDWLEPSFDDSTDTSSASWADDLSYQADGFAMYLSDVLADMADLGYEWSVTRKSTPSGSYTHDLNLWISGNSGTDRTATGPSLTLGGAVVDGQIVKRLPAFTAGVAWGDGDLFFEDTDATAVTTYGRWERLFDAEQYADSATLEDFLDTQFSDESSNRTAAAVKLRGSGTVVPFRDFTVGDELVWQAADRLTKEDRRVQAIVWRHGDPVAEYDVQGSRVYDGLQSVWKAVERLLDAPKKRRRAKTGGAVRPGGGGSMPTVTIAGSDAPFNWANKADFVGDGTLAGDDAALRAAVLAANGGRLVHAGGTLLLNMANGELELNCSFEGLGLGSYINAGTTNPTFDGEPMMTLYEPQTWVKGLYLEGSGGANALGGVRFQDSTCWVAENYISVSGTSVIVDQESYCVIRDNYLIGEEACIEVNASNYTRIIGNYCEAIGDGIALVSSTPTATIIVGNHFVVSDNAVTATGDNDQLIFTDNVVYGDGGLVGVYAEQIIVANNHFVVTSGSPSVDVAATSIGYHVQIVGNVCDGGGIKVAELDAAAASFQGSAVISGNQILEPYQSHGIELVDSDRVIVADNIIVSTTRTGGDLNTYDGINLDANCSGCLIHHNQVVTSSDGDWRYGVNGPAGNFAVGNQMGTGSEYGTGAFGGSLTLTYPGSGNDNFVA